MRSISILGSTGSIGTQALEVIRMNEDMSVNVLSAQKNIDMLYEQIKEFQPKLVCVYEKDKALLLRERLFLEGIHSTEVVYGMDGLVEAARFSDSDIVVTAIVGMIGIMPTIAAIEAGKDIALANKETLVCAGHIIMPLAKEKGVRIYPVDSEHSAIFQSLQGEEGNKIKKILLTASGGPFLHKTLEELKEVTLEDALRHPNWSMGAKITIDSSTMVNKGLEVCEAKWLFDVEVDDIEVLIHPQSILHSAVEFEDGGVIGQFGLPDMKLPISYALTYPNRRKLSGKRLDLFQIGKLEFIKPNLEKFKGLALAFAAIREGGSLPTVFNAANEVAVRLFLEKKISYLEIVERIDRVLDRHKKIVNPNLEEILELQEEIMGDKK